MGCGGIEPKYYCSIKRFNEISTLDVILGVAGVKGAGNKGTSRDPKYAASVFVCLPGEASTEEVEDDWRFRCYRYSEKMFLLVERS